MSTENFNIYEDFSKLNIEKLVTAAGSTKWPKGKRYTVKLNGKDFKIQSYFTSASKKGMCGIGTIAFDAYAAIESMYIRKLRPDEIRWHTGGVQYADPEFDSEKLNCLAAEEIKKRNLFILAVVNLINNQKTMDAIVAAATKKKNGTLHKNRVVRIASNGISDFKDHIYAVVARAKTDLSMSITFEKVLCRPGDNEIWANDFVSIYHEGLPISEAIKEALEK